MIRTEPEYGLQEELLETGELLEYYIGLEGRSANERRMLDGIVWKLMGRHMRLMNERSNVRAMLMEVNTGHPVPIVLYTMMHG